MSEFWSEQTDNEGPWGPGSWIVWHRPDGVEPGTVDDYEIVALCETEKVAEAAMAGLYSRYLNDRYAKYDNPLFIDEKAWRGAYIVAARKLYADRSDDAIEVDDSAKVTQGDEGAFVQAEVWVRNDELHPGE